jgi:hypothetical protein
MTAIGKAIVSPKAQAALRILCIYDEFDGVPSKTPGSGREDVASRPGPFAMAFALALYGDGREADIGINGEERYENWRVLRCIGLWSIRCNDNRSGANDQPKCRRTRPFVGTLVRRCGGATRRAGLGSAVRRSSDAALSASSGDSVGRFGDSRPAPRQQNASNQDGRERPPSAV